ncbi:hypothetical protein NliqN6_6718 [Naganishia liquefaciens]|uniref:Uncharacterized protein n=1 Tax=Naganishia liquefaciens TaxID=104408 RepID=A0A8H3TZ39_9TREE|nr:hypothetical protein NliqN6_6718 [Naganishia liquefaciens]
MAAAGPLGDLPGLVWNATKKKYFPVGAEQDSRLKRQAEPETIRQRLERRKQAPEDRRRKKEPYERKEGSTSKRLAEEPKQRARIDRTLLRATGLQLGYERFSGPTSAEAQRRMRRERGSGYSRMSCITADDEPTFPASLTVMTTIPDQTSSILLGDAMGSIHAVKMEYDVPDWELSHGDLHMADGERQVPKYRRWLWHEINLGKRITGIRATREHYIATTFGPRPRIVVSRIPAMLAAFVPDDAPLPFFGEEEPTVLWDLKKMQDVWSMDCSGNAVAVGGNQRIVYAKDITNPEFRSIQTPAKSDALSVCQMNVNEALVGLRSSSIIHYDFRLPIESAAVSQLELGKSVCGIKALEEGRAGGRSFIASGYTHQLAMFDLRFPRAGPVQRYQGHVNDYRSGLGLATNPTQTHVLAAGSEQKIRAWSIWDAQPVQEYGAQPGMKRLLGQQYPSQISGIEMPEEDKIHILNDRQMETHM